MRFAVDQRRIYAPMEHLELPHQFARIAEDEKALLLFVQAYGRLGWHELVEHEEGSARLKFDRWLRDTRRAHFRAVRATGPDAFYEEPVDWITTHARTVAWCLRAAQALRSDAKRRHCADLRTQLPHPLGRRCTVRQAILRERTSAKLSPVDFVSGMLEDYLWINLEGVRRRVLHVGGGQFQSVWGGDTLLESIYTLVADAVTGGRIAACQSCGAPFVQTDERQRFCPPPVGTDKSLCMNRERMRRQRRKKKEAAHGKTTRTR